MFTSSFRRSFIAAPLTASAVLAAVATLAVSLAAASAVHAAQFTENFDTTANNTSPATFNNDTGGWLVSNPTGTSGAYQSDRSQTVNISTIAAPGFTNLTDTTLVFDLLNAGDSGAVLRSDFTGANAVTLIVRPTLGDLYFIQRTGGNFIFNKLGTVSLAGIVNPGDNLRVTFSSAGDTFNASVASLSAPNTILQSTSYTFAPNTIPASGRAGLYQYGGATSASQFDNMVLGTPAATGAPEPGSSALLGMGLVSGAGTLGVARRRSKAAKQAR